MYPQPGWAEQNPADWWRAMGTAVKTAIASSSVPVTSIAGICVDTTCCTVVALDAGASLLGGCRRRRRRCPRAAWQRRRRQRWQMQPRLKLVQTCQSVGPAAPLLEPHQQLEASVAAAQAWRSPGCGGLRHRHPQLATAPARQLPAQRNAPLRRQLVRAL
jgi:sugar (pentulose or hexulose) kinase